MPSGLLSNFNVAFSFVFPRAVRVNQSQLIEALFSRKVSGGSLSCSAGQVSIYSSNTRVMAASSSVVASGDLVMDTLVSSCGNIPGFLKPVGVFYGNRSFKISITTESHHFKQRCNSTGHLYSNGHRKGRSFSSSSYSDGVVPEVSADASLSAGTLSSLALSTEQNPNISTLKLLSGVRYMPHPEKEETGGEDAHFICEEEQVIGVADGVGGWADVGVNAGLYARELMSNAVQAIREVPDGDIDPLLVLEKAHSRTNAMGSSTACIVCLKNQDLHAINLGDSGFMIVRDGSILFESPVQQHGFNFTYQLERGNTGDQPSSGQVFKIPVVAGDVIVAGSDGLFDNLYNKEIAAIVGDAVKDGLNPGAMAEKIAAVARVRALDRKCRSPFSAAALQAGFAYYGGKPDDLTVVVSYVCN